MCSFSFVLRVLHTQRKSLAIRKYKSSLLFLFGFNPRTRYAVKLIVFESSPRLTAYCLKSCQKRVDTLQVQKR